MDFNPTHVTVTTNDNTIIMVWTVSPQVAAGSVNNNWRGHVGLHWAEIQLSVSLTGVLDDFFHVAIKSRMLVLSTPVTICVDAQVPLVTLFLLETKLFLLIVNNSYNIRKTTTTNQCKRVPDLWRTGSVKIKKYYAKNGKLIPTAKRGKEIKQQWN